VPAWFAEVVIMAQHLATKGLLDAFAQQVRLVRGRFGKYEPSTFSRYYWAMQSVEGGHSTISLNALPLSRQRPWHSLDAPTFPSFWPIWIVRAWKPSARSSNSMALQTGGHRRALAVSSTDRGDATLSLMSMQRVKQHGNERSLAILRYLLLDADSMRFAHPVTKDASEAK